MKTRYGFVSNSSSSSYIIKIRKEFFERCGNRVMLDVTHLVKKAELPPDFGGDAEAEDDWRDEHEGGWLRPEVEAAMKSPDSGDFEFFSIRVPYGDDDFGEMVINTNQSTEDVKFIRNY